VDSPCEGGVREADPDVGAVALRRRVHGGEGDERRRGRGGCDPGEAAQGAGRLWWTMGLRSRDRATTTMVGR
jgi:hypothetical protein